METQNHNIVAVPAEHEMPLVSVIVPVFNVKPYLNECIDSILSQTYSRLEIMIVDDGSTDGGGKICSEYAQRDARIRVFHTKNNGLSCARNYALDRAKGFYIAFLDGDDWMEPKTIEKLLSAALEYQADVSSCRIRQFWINRYNDSNPEVTDPVLFEGEALKLQIAGMDKIKHCVWNKLYKAELFSGIRFPAGKIYEDVSTIYKVLLRTERVVLVPDVLLHYRKRISSLTNSDAVSHPADLWNAFYEKYNEMNTAGLTDDAARALLKKCFYQAERIWSSYHGFKKEEKRQLYETTRSIRSFCRRHMTVIMFDRQVNANIRVFCPFLLFRDPVIFFFLYLAKRIHDKRKKTEDIYYP